MKCKAVLTATGAHPALVAVVPPKAPGTLSAQLSVQAVVRKYTLLAVVADTDFLQFEAGNRCALQMVSTVSKGLELALPLPGTKQDTLSYDTYLVTHVLLVVTSDARLQTAEHVAVLQSAVMAETGSPEFTVLHPTWVIPQRVLKKGGYPTVLAIPTKSRAAAAHTCNRWSDGFLVELAGYPITQCSLRVQIGCRSSLLTINRLREYSRVASFRSDVKLLAVEASASEEWRLLIAALKLQAAWQRRRMVDSTRWLHQIPRQERVDRMRIQIEHSQVYAMFLSQCSEAEELTRQELLAAEGQAWSSPCH